MKRLRRILLVLGVIFAIAAVALFFGARHYLRSQRMAEQVASRLETMIGAPVHVGEVDIGLAGDSTLGDLELHEEGETSPESVWLKADQVHLDLSALKAVRGETVPHHIEVSGATVTLRFDAHGHLLTRLPGHPAKEGAPLKIEPESVPDVQVQKSRIIFKRHGDPDLVISDVDARLSAQDGKLVLSGTGDNPRWGKWSLESSLAEDAKEIAVTFKTAGEVHVTQAMLNDVPFVTRGLWEDVQFPEADTPGVITLRYDLPEKAFHYRIALALQHARLRIPLADFDASNTSGKVVIDDYDVRLRDVQGRAYEGTVTGDADLDFTGPATKLTFTNVTAKGLNVSQVPASWKLPEKIKGRLSGTASLQVVIRHEVPPAFGATTVGLADETWAGPLLAASVVLSEQPTRKIQTTGEGQAVITDAYVAGVPAEPIQLRLHAVPGGFRFKGGQSADSGGAPVRSGPIHRATLTAEDGALLLALAASTTTLLGQAQGPAAPDAPMNRVTTSSAKAANGLAAGIHETFRGITTISHTLAESLPNDLQEIKAAPKKAAAATSYLDVNLKLKDVDLEKFLKGLGLKLPFTAQGRLTFQVQAGIPLNSSGDLKTYRAKGTAIIKNLVLEGVQVDEVQATVVYANGVLDLQSLKGTLTAVAPPGEKAPPPGTFTGKAKFQVVPLGGLNADLTLNAIPLSRVAALAGELGTVRGSVSGSLQAESPAGKLKDLSAWTASGQLATKQVQAAGLTLQDVAATLRLQKGVFHLADLHATLEGGRINGTAEVGLTGTYPYSARASLKDWDLSALQRLIPKWRPPVPVAGRFTTAVDVDGTLKPFTVKTQGTAQAEALRLAQFTFQDLDFSWGSNANRVAIKGLHGTLYGGAVTGDAVLPLQAKVAGNFNLHVKDLDVAALEKDLPKIPVRIQGKVNGDLEGTLPPAAGGQQRAADVTMNLTAPQLKVQNISAEALQAKVHYDKGTFNYHLEGKALGGTIELDGTVPTAEGAAPPNQKQPASEGRLKVNNIDLAPLLEAFSHQAPGTSPLHGRASLTLAWALGGPKEALTGNGTLDLKNLRWHTSEIGTLRSPVLIRDDYLYLTGLEEISGPLGGGKVRSQVQISLKRNRPTRFTLHLERVEAANLLGPWLKSPEQVQGPLTMRLEGRSLGEDWYGDADAVLEHGKVAGIDVTELRLPFRWSYGPTSGRLEVNAPDVSGQVARGRLLSRISFTWSGYTASVDGQARFLDLQMQELSRSLAGRVGNGRLNGRFDFSGRDMRSIDDLTGLLDATLGNAQAAAVPVLEQISPLLSISPSTTFNKGLLKARLARGLFRIEQFSLESGFLSVYAQGNVGLGGSLNLDMFARTHRVGLDPTRLRLLGLRIPAFGPIPVTLLLEANALLSNQVVHLRITGTIRNPYVRVLPGATLTQEAIRFFFNRYNLPMPNAGTGF